MLIYGGFLKWGLSPKKSSMLMGFSRMVYYKPSEFWVPPFMEILQYCHCLALGVPQTIYSHQVCWRLHCQRHRQADQQIQPVAGFSGFVVPRVCQYQQMISDLWWCKYGSRWAILVCLLVGGLEHPFCFYWVSNHPIDQSFSEGWLNHQPV